MLVDCLQVIDFGKYDKIPAGKDIYRQQIFSTCFDNAIILQTVTDNQCKYGTNTLFNQDERAEKSRRILYSCFSGL